jgi:hypothetical protein
MDKGDVFKTYNSIDNIASIPLEKKLKINPLMKDGRILANTCETIATQKLA